MKNPIFTFIPILLMAALCIFSANAQQGISSKSLELANTIRSNDYTSFIENYSEEAVIGIDALSGLRPLHLACQLGQTRFVEFMLLKEQTMETGVYVTQEEKAPMIHAIEQGHTEIIKLLFEKGKRNSKGLWMQKSYLFHALDMNASQAVIDLLLEYGCSMDEAKSQMKQSSNDANITAMAEKLTTELDSRVTLNKYQKIDAFNTHLRIAQMLQDVREKYVNDAVALTTEEQEIMDYRNEKLKGFLNLNQLNNLK